tara:strand:+ start:200 stop:397 length:198 start_codon:yes stop_codon:yes gene_type:complete
LVVAVEEDLEMLDIHIPIQFQVIIMLECLDLLPVVLPLQIMLVLVEEVDKQMILMDHLVHQQEDH